MTSREMVAEFMRHIGSETPNRETDREPEVAGTRMSLILEELFETHTALLRGDAVEAADGYADLKYVVVGAAVAYGLPIDDFFQEPACPPFGPGAAEAASLLLAATPFYKDTVYSLCGYGPPAGLAMALKSLDVATSQAAAAAGLPLRELFAEVHRSNMSKEPGYRIGAAKYGPGGGKGPGYRPPDIRRVLREAGWPE